jgi:hypothetical protein
VGLSNEMRTYHSSESTGRYDVAGVNKAVQVSSRLLDLFPHVIVAVEVEDICD